MLRNESIRVDGPTYLLDKDGKAKLALNGQHATAIEKTTAHGMSLLRLPYPEKNSTSGGYHCSGLIADLVSAMSRTCVGSLRL